MLEHSAQRGYGCLVLDSDVTIQGPKTCLPQLCSLGADHRIKQINAGWEASTHKGRALALKAGLFFQQKKGQFE